MTVNNSININKPTSHLKSTDYNRDGQIRSFVDISDMVEHHCLHYLFIISTISVI